MNKNSRLANVVVYIIILLYSYSVNIQILLWLVLYILNMCLFICNNLIETFKSCLFVCDDDDDFDV